MLKSELIELIKDMKDTDNIDSVVEPSFLNLEKIKAKSKDDKDIKAWLDSEKDKHSSKALDTWKSGNKGQEYAIDKFYELYPDKKPKDPKDLEIEKLKREITAKEELEAREKLKNKALKELTEKKLPTDLIDMLVGKDENLTNDNLSLFDKVITKVVTEAKQQFAKDNSYTPPGDGGGAGTSTSFIDVIKNNQVKRD